MALKIKYLHEILSIILVIWTFLTFFMGIMFMSSSNTKNNLNPKNIDSSRPNFHTFDSFIKKKYNPKDVINRIDALMNIKIERGDGSTDNMNKQREPYCMTMDQNNQCSLHTCNENSAENNVKSSNDAKNLQFSGHELRREQKIRVTKMMVGGRAIWASGCALSHKHRFIYVHVLKSGGSTIKSFLRRALCFENGDTQGKFLCGQDKVNMRGSNILQAADCLKAVQQFPGYFIFSFVRNPFSRIYSSYAMAISRDYKKDVIPSFEEFLTHKKRDVLSKLSPTHYIPQTAFLFDKGKCPVVDFIGKLENFEEDFSYVLNKINSTDLLTYKEIHGIAQTNKYGAEARSEKLGGNLQNAFYKASLVQMVANQYPNDFINFGYDPRVVPK